jgi:hypothetical protein
MKPFRIILFLLAAAFLALLVSAITGVATALAFCTMLLLLLLAFGQVPAGALSAITDLGDILWGDGDDNMGGLRTEALYCLHSDVETHSEPASRASATTLSQLVTVTADHGFKAGKGWKRCYTTEDKAMVESTIQGEKDGKSFLNKIQLHFPGATAEIMGFIRFIVNAGMYAIGVDAEGRKRMVGTQHWPAKIDAGTITTTETAAGLKGVTFSLVCSSPYPAPIVTAASLVLEEDLSASGS